MKVSKGYKESFDKIDWKSGIKDSYLISDQELAKIAEVDPDRGTLVDELI